MVFSLCLGYPVAYLLSFHAGTKKNLLYQLLIIPLWVSYLVRAYAWQTILGTDGVLNTSLQYLHLASHPLQFLLLVWRKPKRPQQLGHIHRGVIRPAQ